MRLPSGAGDVYPNAGGIRHLEFRTSKGSPSPARRPASRRLRGPAATPSAAGRRAGGSAAGQRVDMTVGHDASRPRFRTACHPLEVGPRQRGFPSTRLRGGEPMQKVVGSSPIIRSIESPAPAGFFFLQGSPSNIQRGPGKRGEETPARQRSCGSEAHKRCTARFGRARRPAVGCERRAGFRRRERRPTRWLRVTGGTAGRGSGLCRRGRGSRTRREAAAWRAWRPWWAWSRCRG
jgi:hypothetical protein